MVIALATPFVFALFGLSRETVYRFLLESTPARMGEWSFSQSLLWWMVILHYVRLVMEACAFEFSKKTMGHNILAYKMTVNGIFAGFAVAFYSFHPFYTAPKWLDYETRPIWVGALISAFFVSELMSYLSTQELSKMYTYRKEYPQAAPELFIPKKHGFSRVTCVNYFWRLCS
jgi:hypothetical protein